MDFSAYGVPSKQWLEFTAKNPAALQEGHSGNDPSEAQMLRAASNKTRESTEQRLMSEKRLHSRIHIETIEVPSREKHKLAVRRFAPHNIDSYEAKVLVFFHGGGLLFGSETSDDVVCSTISLTLNIIVLSIIYRHTPEFKHPAQHNDAWDAFVYVRNGANNLRVNTANGVYNLGTSAGAGLAAGVVLRDLKDQKNRGNLATIAGVVLNIPWLIHIDNYPFEQFVSREKTAKIQCLDAPVVPAARLRLFADILGAYNVEDLLLNTALATEGELDGWPKTAFLVAGMDPLRDDGLSFATRLKALRRPTLVHVFPGVPHGFRRWSELPICKIFDEHLLASIDWAMQQENPGSSMDAWLEHYGS